MGILDAIGHLNKVPFEDMMIPDLGTVLWFQADFQVEAEDGAYAFFSQQIYTQQTSPEGADGYFPVPTNTAGQLILELELRNFVQSSELVYQQLSNLADEAGLKHWLDVAA
ncbi:MAG: hypothetical protein V7703_02630 [Hyphomicrobiales bacterium]